MPIVTRFVRESVAMNYARAEARKGHSVYVCPADDVGADTVVFVSTAPQPNPLNISAPPVSVADAAPPAGRRAEVNSACELSEWLRGLDDGFNQDGDLCREAADQLDALGRIHTLLDGQEWGSGTAADIAEELRGLGMAVRAPSDCDCDSRSWHGAEHDSACPLVGLPRV